MIRLGKKKIMSYENRLKRVLFKNEWAKKVLAHTLSNLEAIPDLNKYRTPPRGPNRSHEKAARKVNSVMVP